MISNYGRELAARPVRAVVSWLHAAGISPNAVTAVGFILTVVAALVLSQGYFRAGALVLLAASLCDMLDGSLARLTGQSSIFGAFLDSTIDRYAESITFLALVYYYSGVPGARTEIVLIFVILVGSLMVSYTRARAEALQVECKAGMLQRPERVILLILGLLVGAWLLVPVLWIMAIFTNVSAVQRIYEVYTKTSEQERALNGTPNGVQPKDNWPVQG
jgi:CDP-diacylglycerol--glycerol-3-phosphate 3-phosphatidyltransferase